MANENEIKEEVVYENAVSFSSPDEIHNLMDENQIGFSKSYKKTRNINIGVLSVFAVALILCWILQAQIGVMIAIIVLYIVFLIVFQKKTRKKLNDDASNCVKTYFRYLDSYVYSGEGFENVEFNVSKKLDVDTIKSLRIVKDIIHVGGRDEIKATYHGYDVLGGDSIIKTRETNEEGKTQDYIVFLGKLMMVNKNVINDGRTIVYLKGKGANGPTDIEDLHEVNGLLTEKFKVLTSSNTSPLFSHEVCELFESFQTNDDLIDAFFVIERNRISLGLSYSDAVMNAPILTPVGHVQVEQVKHDVEKFMKIVDALDEVELPEEVVVEEVAVEETPTEMEA